MSYLHHLSTVAVSSPPSDPPEDGLEVYERTPSGNFIKQETSSSRESELSNVYEYWAIIAENGGGLCPPGFCPLKLPTSCAYTRRLQPDARCMTACCASCP